ncbi:hypothetical protein L7F22_048234 [Adiantum nelumboides]|nr:hypothetical protein [Adiantum nelumboides]
MSAVLAKPQVKDFLKTLAKGKEKGQEQRKEHDVNAHAVTAEGEPSKKPWEEDIPELSSPSYSPLTSFSYSSDSSSSSNPRRHTVEAYKKIKLALEKTQSKQKKAADRHRRELVFSLGDWVLLRFEKARLRKMKGKQRLFLKLGMRYYGPFQVCDKISDVAYRLKLPEDWKIHNAFHVSLLRPFVGDVPEDMVPEEQPEVEELDEILVPKQILAHKDRKVGKVARRYLVKFKIYSPMDAKWMEEGEFVDSPQLLQLYLEAFQLQPTVHSAGQQISQGSTLQSRGFGVSSDHEAKIEAVSFQLRLSPSWTMHNVFHVSWLKPYVGPPLDDMTDEQQPEVLDKAEERKSIRPTFSAEGIYGGALLAVRSNDFVCFYDWADCRVIRRIDVTVKDIYWADSGDLVTISSDNSFYILKYNRDAVAAHTESGKPIDEQGVEDAFELLHEISERVRTGIWVGDCFIYNNSAWRLNYCVGGEVTTMYHLDRPMYLLGYLASQSRVYLIDKEFNIMSYTLLLSLIEYKTLVMRGDMERAEEVLPTIPKEQYNNVARFLESRNMLVEALAIVTDPDYKFDLAVQLGELEVAKDIAEKALSESKWKQLGELAMSSGKLDVAEECMTKAEDLSGLLLLYSSLGNSRGMKKLASLAQGKGKINVAFVCLFMLGQLEECLQLLVDSNRIPEAAFMARAYLPSKVSEIVKLWRNDLKEINQKAAESLADPQEYPNLFPDWQWALEAEARMKPLRESLLPANEYMNHSGRTKMNIIEEMKALHLNGGDEAAENGDIFHEAEDVTDDAEVVEDFVHEDGGVLVNGYDYEEPADGEVLVNGDDERRD